MSDAPIHSTGRGGAGNVGHDPNEYVDAGIVREGVAGTSADGEYSAGRGGAGNIVEVPAGDRRTSQDVVPKANEIPHEGHEDFHTGRGGGGNVHKEKFGGHTSDPTKPSLIEKAKAFLTGKKKELTSKKESKTTT